MSSLSVAEVFLGRLKALGVDYFFNNPGTDFAPIVEAYARGAVQMPLPVIATHENLAMGMAHGFAMVSGRAQAVMTHVNVGTANALAGVINAASSQVPVMVCAGRTPLFQDGPAGARSIGIHWVQEMRDQGSLVREFTRWDYELRDGHEMLEVIDRAFAVMNGTPAGPVYLSLPREVLARDVAGADVDRPLRLQPTSPGAGSPQALERFAGWLHRAKQPIAIVSSVGRSAAGVDALGRFAAAWGVPVVEYRPKHMNLPSSHAWHAGVEAGELLQSADLILVIDHDVPWIPAAAKPPAATRIVQIAGDPLFTAYPTRSFASDLAIAGDTALILDALAALGKDVRPAVRDERARVVAARRAAQPAAPPSPPAKMTAPWASYCIGAAKKPDTIIVNEYPLIGQAMDFEQPLTLFGGPPAGALGWGLPAALGAKLAKPGTDVIACLGEGAYLFCNPIACHQAAKAYDIPVLTIIFNNAEYAAVRRATQAMYPGGAAVKMNVMPLTQLDGLPPFHEVVKLFGGFGEEVSDPAALPAALQRALAATRNGQQALLNLKMG